MNFVELFDDSVRVKVLDLLLSDPEKVYSQSEISRRVGCSVSSVGRALEPLMELGLIKTLNFKGQVKIVAVNKDHPVTNKLIKFRKEISEL
ncbi:MAG: winged helix-turn-helix domain-containing protein [Thermoproteota archaeon]|nr:helix-turn-helix domain-containing protein [Candidatus Brockarchaeota archaeon]MBO3762594.1 helix-turn-helix domain-containing protein [Candidatus Brockarchaeota archaeon]MBO3768419.1 helix-turn-helix domain-containing protein [Candidatus Brockarchaeota archaeon]MBO3801386.1 helix-turn-helix domain-containing protein [Candidatus Brockarchaeota archaeon]